MRELFNDKSASKKIIDEKDIGLSEIKKRPDWLKVKLGAGKNFFDLTNLVKGKRLNTVCEEAKCPNIGECWNNKTATFMILGDVCTRSCGFCAIKAGLPELLDLNEPIRIADAVLDLQLKHCVITSVTRDDLADGGASVFSETVRLIRDRNPNITIEILIPDFKGNKDNFEIILKNKPDILNHNIETVPRLYEFVRPQAKYQRSLDLIKWFHQQGLRTKSGIMVGIGENNDEIIKTLDDLYLFNCDIVTIGQYLQPTKEHLPIDRFVTPEEFNYFNEYGIKKGFLFIESAPLVRSSYHADKHTKKQKKITEFINN